MTEPETTRERDARLDRESADRLEATKAAVVPQATPLEMFKRVWEGESNSGTEHITGPTGTA